MQISRRDLFRSAAAVSGAAALGGLSAEAVAGTGPAARAAARAATRTTVLVRGAAGPGGYRPVVTAAGESWLVRTDLGTRA
ncbi:MAG TPA: hypothetical protein VD864_03465, partial [Nocardioides sp.]|nr:hypothetical protein [Nocardioides sp.]